MLTRETIEIQHELANYCKSGQLKPIVGAKQDRLHNYRRLIYNIIDDAIESAYPIVRSFLDESQWNEMIDAFVLEHKCQHPQIMYMPGELIDFAKLKNYSTKFELPWLIDLLNFEWVEVIVHTMKDQTIGDFKSDGDFKNQPLAFSPYFQLLELEYPIHKLRTRDINTEKGNYFMLVYRQENGTVQYLELNQLTYFIVQEMNENSCSLLEAINPILIQTQPDIRENFIQNALSFIENLRGLGIVLGTK